MLRQPLPHLWVTVSPVVVEDQMQFLFLWKLAIQALKEAKEFLMAMLLVALPNHTPLGNLEGCKKGRCAVALIVVGKGSTSTGFDWQAHLRVRSKA